ncbi:hypothetical protein SLA2020_033560 [Shorea laevis]
MITEAEIKDLQGKSGSRCGNQILVVGRQELNPNRVGSGDIVERAGNYWPSTGIERTGEGDDGFEAVGGKSAAILHLGVYSLTARTSTHSQLKPNAMRSEFNK